MHSRGFDGCQIPPLLLWHIYSGRIGGRESASSIIQKIHRDPQQGNEMGEFSFPFFNVSTLHSNVLSLYFTFPWYLALTWRLASFFHLETWRLQIKKLKTNRMTDWLKKINKKKTSRRVKCALDLLGDLCLCWCLQFPPIYNLSSAQCICEKHKKKSNSGRSRTDQMVLTLCDTSALYSAFPPNTGAPHASIARKKMWLQESLPSCRFLTGLNWS